MSRIPLNHKATRLLRIAEIYSKPLRRSVGTGPGSAAQPQSTDDRDRQ
jgi:hypothetical protein